jgi:hypothetical protein
LQHPLPTLLEARSADAQSSSKSRHRALRIADFKSEAGGGCSYLQLLAIDLSFGVYVRSIEKTVITDFVLCRIFKELLVVCCDVPIQ